MIPEPMAVTLEVTQVLETLGVPCFIAGSLASAVHGVARATLDADIVADLRPEHAEPFAQALGGAFHAQGWAIRRAVEEGRSFNVIHMETMFKVDIFLPKPRAFDRAQFERRIRLVLARDPERAAYVASPEDTILSKLEWYRLGREVSERQWRDVVGVLKSRAARLDVAYVRHLAGELGVSNLLQRALTEAGIKEIA